MKSLQYLTTALIICLMVNPLAAQTDTTRSLAERVDRSMLFLKKHTGANEEQQAQARPVYTQYFTSLDSLRALGEKKKGPGLQTIQAARNTQLASFLSEAQMEQLKAAEKSLMQQRRQRKRGNA